MDITQQPYTILSLCPGSGGLERGVEQVLGKLRIAAYVEIEAFICQNLLGLMEAGVLDPAPIWTDLKTFDPQPFRGRIHGITAGYPCQPFSYSGSRSGTADPRHLWPYIEGAIRATEPIFVLFENVSGHLSLGFDQVARSLQQMGYAIEAGLFGAIEVGAPHLRSRLFILGIHLGHAHSFRQTRNIRRQQEIKPTQPSTDIPHAHGLRPQGQRAEAEQQSNFVDFGTASRWPSPRGVQQKKWEHGRTLAPGMGCTAYGYNLREDLLRMYGNAVVPDQAAFALETLLAKLGV